MRYRTVLIDADDTVLDYRRAERAALEGALCDEGLPFDPERDLALYSKINRGLWRELERGALDPAELGERRFAAFCERNGYRADPAALSGSYLDHLSQTGFLIPGALELLEQLYRRVRLVLITNGFARVQRARVRKAGIEPYFAMLAISEEIGVQKPESGIFEHVFAKLSDHDREDPYPAVIVGDSLSSDIAGGNAFGIDTCWFNQGGRRERGETPVGCEIHALAELVPIVAGDGERVGERDAEGGSDLDGG